MSIFIQHHWGTIDYAEALARMRALHAAVAAGHSGAALIVCNHPPVFTAGRRGGSGGPEGIAGIPLIRTERGGLLTYHDSGQIIIYPVMRLRGRAGEFRKLACALEETAIRFAASFGIAATHHEGQPGVFCDRGKIASLGLAVKRQTTLHGLAVNIRTNKENFGRIAACGVAGQPIANVADYAAAPENALELAPRLIELAERHLTPIIAPCASLAEQPAASACQRPT